MYQKGHKKDGITLIGASAAPLHILGEAGEVDDPVVVVYVDVKKLDARAEMVHELAEGARRYGPVVLGLVLVEFGMGSSLGFKGKRVRGRDPYGVVV